MKPNTSTLRAAVALAWVGTLASCGGDSDNSLQLASGTVIRNATVIDTRDGSKASNRNIVLDGGKIIGVTDRNVLISGSAQSVDGTGKFVVPGFLDMHTHALDNPRSGVLLLANGVTGIREMGGVPNNVALARQQNIDVAAGRVDAPEVLLAPGDIMVGVASAASAVQGVALRKAAGVDFIKIVGANRAGFLATLSEAKAQGLTVAGHLTPAVSALEASNAGLRAIEHTGSGMGSLLDCAGDEPAIRNTLLIDPAAPPTDPSSPAPVSLFVPNFGANALNAPLYQRVLDSYSADKCAALVKAFVANDTWQVPTLYRVRAIETADDPLFAADPRLVYADKSTQALWATLARSFGSLPASAKATYRQYYEQQKKLTKLMKANGVKMMAGSDTANIAVWVIAGFSLHDEFKELAAAGLTPLEILQMTTLTPAEFLGRQSTMGTVEEGKNADLVLLDADPTADVANLDKISAVFLKGRYLSKAALDQLKAGIASSVSKQPAGRVDTRQPDHVD